MKNYEAKKPSYFATPSPQLIHALHTALSQILQKPIAERFARHREVSDKVKKAVADLGLKQVAAKPEDQAHAMTAIYLPENVKGTDLLPNLAKRGVVFAGGIHKEIAPKYIRFGHMGVSAVSVMSLGSHPPCQPPLPCYTSHPRQRTDSQQVDPKRSDIDNALKALKEALADCGYKAN